jgi:hypothetical protein
MRKKKGKDRKDSAKGIVGRIEERGSNLDI